MKTYQESYDMLVEAASNGTFPSLNERGGCAYRGPDGKACAAGIFIPNNKYRKEMETKLADTVVGHFGNVFDTELPLAAICRIQNIHDDMAHAVQRGEGPWVASTFVTKLNNLAYFNDPLHRVDTAMGAADVNAT